MDFNATFIIAFISFIVFIFIMNKILYAPIYNVIQKRKNLIDNNYEQAKKNSDEANAILEEKKQTLLKANNDVRKKTIEMIEQTKNKNVSMINEAKKQSMSEIEQNLNSVNSEILEAKVNLKEKIVDLAQLMTDKFIQSEYKIKEDEELINSIDKMI